MMFMLMFGMDYVHALTDAGDKLALQRLYAATGRGEGNCLGGSQWGNSSSDPCDDGWYGVQCVIDSENCSGQPGDTRRRVLSLILQGCGLSGRLDHILVTDMGQQLSQLQVLDLAMNQLSGAIPYSLGQLSQIQQLALYNNPLGGAIPDSLGQLSHTQQLILGYNQLSGAIPASLGRLLQLQQLFLSANYLSGAIPDSFGQLSQLQLLDLSTNQLTGVIPDSFDSQS